MCPKLTALHFLNRIELRTNDLERLSQLKSLSLPIDINTLTPVNQLTNLTFLKLRHFIHHSHLKEVVENLPKLETLILNDVNLTTADLSMVVQQATNLRMLDIGDNPALAHSTLHLPTTQPFRLQTLLCNNIEERNGAGLNNGQLNELIKLCPLLEHLEMNRTKVYGYYWYQWGIDISKSLDTIASTCNRLKYISIQLGEKNDAGLLKVFRACSSTLTSIIIHAYSIDKSTLEEMATICKNLRVLVLRIRMQDRLQMDSVLKALGNNCHQLEELDTEISFTKTGLRFLGGCSKLVRVNLKGGLNLSMADLKEFSKKCPRITSVQVLKDKHFLPDLTLRSIFPNYAVPFRR
jgi:hypothetical protein